VKSPWRDESGLDLVELRITIAFVAVVVVVFSFWHWGFSLAALKGIAGAPLIVIAFACALSLIAGAFLVGGSLLARRRVAIVVRAMESGSPGADAEAQRIAFTFGIEDALTAKRDRLLRLAEAPASRVPALRLLLRSRDLHRIDLDALVGQAAGELPEELMIDALRRVKSDESRATVAAMFLARAGASTRRRLLDDLFSRYGVAPLPDEPPARWLPVLVNCDADLATLAGPGLDPERIARYRSAITALRVGMGKA